MSKTSRTNSGSKRECKPGQILREGYTRNSYWRNAYTRADGVRVPRTKVAESQVPPTCVPDMGNPGRGEKVLPKPGNIIHLSAFGYSIRKSKNQRQKALLDASEKYGMRKVLGRLNLLRNYQAIPENKQKFSKDVEYLKGQYQKISKTGRTAPPYDVYNDPKERGRQANPNNRRKQKGGIDNNIDTDEEAIPEVGTRIQHTQREVCEDNKCRVQDYVEETHEANGRKVTFITLTETDADAILELDKRFYDKDRTIDQVMKNLSANPGQLIGVKINDVLEGYCQYVYPDANTAKIICFSVNSGYCSTLYSFMAKYFGASGHNRVLIPIELSNDEATARMNFWIKHGFSVFRIALPEIWLEKYLDSVV